MHAPVIATAFEITLCKSRARQSLIDENLAEFGVTREHEPIGSGRLEEESALSLPSVMTTSRDWVWVTGAAMERAISLTLVPRGR